MEDPLWQPETKADWEANTSTKIKNLIDILLHHLGKDNAPLLRRADGDSNDLEEDPLWELEEQDDDNDKADYPDRIVIYVAFPSNNQLITAASWILQTCLYLLTDLDLQVLRFYKIKYIEINGSKRTSMRSKDIEKFRTSGRNGPRVCLLSNVGTMGLNLPQANILVALVSFCLLHPYSLTHIKQDQMWSHQELLQLIGRIWRHPQKKQVLVYQPCLEHATDMFLSVLSFSKNALLAAFTKSSKDTSKFLFTI